MVEQRVQRRLAAVMSADVVGYSRLMGADEKGTLSALKDLRRNVISPILAEYRGRLSRLTAFGASAPFDCYWRTLLLSANRFKRQVSCISALAAAS